MKIFSFRGFRMFGFYFWGLTQTLTLQRLLNYLKIYSSYFLSIAFKKPLLSGKPLAVSIEPTTSCNLRCPECPSGSGFMNRPKGQMALQDFERLLSALPTEVMWLNLYFQGEPYLNRNFHEMVRIAKKRKMFVITSTNGHFLDAQNAAQTVLSGLDKIIISLDGSTAETFAHYRKGGDFEKVLIGIRNLSDARRELKKARPFIVLQSLVFKHNEHQLNDMKTLSHQLGADALVLKSAQHYHFEGGKQSMTTLDKFSRYRKNPDGKFELKQNLHNRCLRMWTSCVITWDGEVIPCCYDKDAGHSYGNITKTDFGTIWRGKEAMEFRQAVLNNRKEISICQNCGG